MAELDLTFEVPSIAPEVVRRAWLTWGPERLKLWPNLSSSWYEPYDVREDERWAEVREGSEFMGAIWARERYEWRDGGAWIKSTVLDSNVFEAGATVEVWITPRDGDQPGTNVRMVNRRRPSKGLKGKAMGLAMRLMGRRILNDAFVKSWKGLEANCREVLGLNPDGKPVAGASPTEVSSAPSE